MVRVLDAIDEANSVLEIEYRTPNRKVYNLRKEVAFSSKRTLSERLISSCCLLSHDSLRPGS
ncbi:hypothetical protein [Bradyrhizobium sp. CCBAU 25338]|uniref:hypothetical protein n=1 Tax=Bradyrhizobium sp. CCBAU 25338 TaxID=1641877 RepID=UPI003FA47CA7